VTVQAVEGFDRLQFTQSDFSGDEGTSVVIQVTRTFQSAGSLRNDAPAVTVDFASADGSASAGSDYQPVQGTLSWAAGETGIRQFSIQLNSDNVLEQSETFSVTLSNPGGGATLATPATTTVTINDGGRRNLSDVEGLTPNQQAVAEALDELCLDTTSAPLQAQCDNLFLLDDNGVRIAMEQLAPEQLAALASNALKATQVPLDHIRQRQTQLRNNSRGFTSEGLALSIGDQSLPIGQLADALLQQFGGSASSDAGDALGGRLGGFVSGRVDVGDKDETEREPGYDVDTQGVSVGIDYRVTDQLIAGGSVSYADTDSDFDNSRGDIDSRSITGSVYGSYYFDERYYFDAIVSYGSSSYDISRRIIYSGVDTATDADTDGRQWAVSASVGADFYRDAWLFSPYIKLDYIDVDIDGYRETGGNGLALIVDDQSVTSLTSVVGGRVSRAYGFSWGVLTPTVTLEWLHEFKDDSRLITSRFAEDPRTAFSISTDDPSRDYLNFGVGTGFTFTGGRSAFLSYEALIGKDDYSNHSIQAGFRMEF
jgi:outer membrane autotransporter protein